MDYKKTCPHCGHQETAYTHSLNEGLAVAFKRLCEYYLKSHRACNVNKELELTHNQLANFQKLRYFGLVSDTPEGWYPSQLGLDWYFGKVRIANPAGSLNNVPLADDHEAWRTHKNGRKMVNIVDILPAQYRQRSDYQGERSNQGSLL